MKPPKSILSRDFRYRNSANTDVATTFKRIRDQQKKEREALEHKLISIQRKKA